MPEQVWTFLSVYLAKKSVGNAFKEDIYFMYQMEIQFLESLNKSNMYAQGELQHGTKSDINFKKIFLFFCSHSSQYTYDLPGSIPQAIRPLS